MRDLPGQTVRAGALAGGLLSGVSCYEWLVLLVWSLLGGGLWVLLSLLMAGVLSGAVLAADPAALARSAAAALGLTALALLIVVSGRRLLRRGAEKGALTVLTVLGQRIYTAGPPEAADGQTAQTLIPHPGMPGAYMRNFQAMGQGRSSPFLATRPEAASSTMPKTAAVHLSI